MEPVVLSGGGLTIDDVVAVARDGRRAALGDDARAAMEKSREIVERLASSGQPVYGVSTGFGSLADVYIEPDDRARLQAALIRSHAAGLGEPVEAEVVRAMMLLRARTLAMARSGARPVLVDTLLALLAADITPRVPEHGSLGCSGDLAPLAHVALVLLGEGHVVVDGACVEAAPFLAAAGIDPVVLEAKEGLALVNGTDGMLGMLALACHDVARLVTVADITAAMSVEALLGTDAVFAAELVGLRPHVGQARSAANLRRLLEGSPIVASHRVGDSRVQDAYSLRCAPQVHGAVRDALVHVEAVCETELEAAIDNPVVLPDGRVSSNGNFHGAPLAYAADYLAIVLADLSSMAERRVDRMLDPARSHGLPAFLADTPGVDSGLMIAQYTAAALVDENRRLATPASVGSIPTSAMQEDHVSMGWAAARKLRIVIANLTRVLAIELVAAAQAIDLRSPLTPGAGTGAAVRALRDVVAGPGPDRWITPDLDVAEELVRVDALRRAVEDTTGPLA
jgi:histidine ammonia-lyase